MNDTTEVRRGPAGRRDRFGLLLVLLLASFLITGVSDARWTKISAALLNLAVLGVGFRSTALSAHRRRVIVLAVLGLLGTILMAVPSSGDTGDGLGSFCQVVVLGAVLLAVVARVLEHEHVTLPTILGAISAYVLIGLVFAWIYTSLGALSDRAVLDPPDQGFPMYYSFVVLTTVGFGDITPVGAFTQRITALEGMIGQVFLATLVARLVSLYGRRREG